MALLFPWQRTIFAAIHPDSDGILRRQFTRNIGFGVFENAVPNAEKFLIKIALSANAVEADAPFPVMSFELELIGENLNNWCGRE
jgi:hypothetical protein